MAKKISYKEVAALPFGGWINRHYADEISIYVERDTDPEYPDLFSISVDIGDYNYGVNLDGDIHLDSIEKWLNRIYKALDSGHFGLTGDGYFLMNEEELNA